MPPELAAGQSLLLDSSAPRPLDSPKLAAYRDLLLEWNQLFNLTAITDPVEVDRELIGDALAMLPAIDRLSPRLPDFPTRRLVDIGTGAGFPGVPLKIARPDLRVTLVEATGKKVNFLQHVIAELGLTGIKAIHARAEDLGQAATFRNRFDLATARAVASLPALLELAVPFLRVGGFALFPKSVGIGDELAEGQRAAKLVGARIVSADRLPGIDTRLVIAEKTGPTPKRFPRRAGVPAREPLGRIAR